MWTLTYHTLNTLSNLFLYVLRRTNIYCVKHAFDRRTLITAINVLVLSKLFYCSNVWTALFQLQHRQTVNCTEFRLQNSKPLLKDLNSLPVPIFISEVPSWLLNVSVIGRAPEYLSNKFIKRANVSKYSTLKLLLARELSMTELLISGIL